jgi:hypothetical protein
MSRANAAPYAALIVLFASCAVFTREVPVDDSPPAGAEGACVRKCVERAHGCRRAQCARGCNLVLDRLAEHEGKGIVACVSAAASCDDWTWARCAARVGTHADGGPPGPPPPEDDVEE